jgi:hypothetical protein
MPAPGSNHDSADEGSVFAGLVTACLHRFLAQNDRPAPPAAALTALAGRLWRVVRREAPAASAGPEWREIPAAQVEAMAGEVLDDSLSAEARADLGVPLRQLLKACLQAEPVRCRESYREVVAGSCRRQDLSRARGRISGVHCVDCPYWVTLKAEKNAALMERAWVEGPPARFHAERGVFLPEDFRALRRWARKPTVRSD